MASAISYLDYIKLNSLIPLNYKNEQIKFYIKPSQNNLIFRQNINSSNQISVWDITDPYKISEHEITKADDSDYFFTYSNEKFQNKIAFRKEALDYPRFIKVLENSDILDHNNPDLLIITHKKFIEQAERLKKLRESKDLLNVEIQTVDDVYNQFSSGNLDVSSIRNYIKYVYNTSSKNLKYVLLFGDCSYDYKHLSLIHI